MAQPLHKYSDKKAACPALIIPRSFPCHLLAGRDSALSAMVNHWLLCKPADDHPNPEQINLSQLVQAPKPISE